MTRAIIAVIFCFAAYAFPCRADMSWEQRDIVTVSGEKIEKRQTIHVSPEKFIIESSEGMRLIVDLAAEVLVTLNLNSRTYWKTSFRELKEMRDRITEETERLVEDALAVVPEDQRESYRRELLRKLGEEEPGGAGSGNAGPPPEAFTPTGETQKILGLTARKYVAEGPGGSVYEMWCTKEMDLSDLTAFTKRAGKVPFLEEVGKSISFLPLGFPLKSVQKKADTTIESIVLSIRFDRIPAALSTIPGDFKPLSDTAK